MCEDCFFSMFFGFIFELRSSPDGTNGRTDEQTGRARRVLRPIRTAAQKRRLIKISLEGQSRVQTSINATPYFRTIFGRGFPQ